MEIIIDFNFILILLRCLATRLLYLKCIVSGYCSSNILSSAVSTTIFMGIAVFQYCKLHGHKNDMAHTIYLVWLPHSDITCTSKYFTIYG